MVRTASTMLPLGETAPDFSLPDVVSGGSVQRADFVGYPGLLVMFICNHCPYVKHIADRLAEVTAGYLDRGLGVVAISSNDTEKYPQDDADAMRTEAQQRGYRFPYLLDESQAVAKAYQAACTPDFFLFDSDFALVYRGQFDDSRPGGDVPVSGADLSRAVDALLSGQPIPEPQRPSLGCNIKWKPGNEPAYFPTTPH